MRPFLAMGAVLVQVRAVGKSTLAKKLAKSDISLDASASLIELAKISPDVVLAGQTPRFIDECKWPHRFGML